jgi:hypothetical protein
VLAIFIHGLILARELVKSICFYDFFAQLSYPRRFLEDVDRFGHVDFVIIVNICEDPPVCAPAVSPAWAPAVICRGRAEERMLSEEIPVRHGPDVSPDLSNVVSRIDHQADSRLFAARFEKGLHGWSIGGGIAA